MDTLLALRGLLGGSWVVISRVRSRVTILITHIKGLITPLITTHEPPSRVQGREMKLRRLEVKDTLFAWFPHFEFQPQYSC